LSGFTVLTEAASGAFVVTPIIAAMAGADRVLALTRDSKYATAQNVIRQTRALEELCQGPRQVDIFTTRSMDLFFQADIVTNLGFVRPIDRQAVAAMKPTAAVPLMCEAWEFRNGDVDLAACRAKGIVVLATNEDHPAVNVFAYSGWVALKMLLDAGLEAYKSRILIVSHDKFGMVISDTLSRAGIAAILVESLRGIRDIEDMDAILIADYCREKSIIGPDGQIGAPELAQRAPRATVIQFAGRVDLDGLKRAGMAVFPGCELGPHRMARTLAALGPRPVIELHAAGLRVGQGIAQSRLRDHLNPFEAARNTLASTPAQDLKDLIV
jgi:hypothetical protein